MGGIITGNAVSRCAIALAAGKLSRKLGQTARRRDGEASVVHRVWTGKEERQRARGGQAMRRPRLDQRKGFMSLVW